MFVEAARKALEEFTAEPDSTSEPEQGTGKQPALKAALPKPRAAQ